MTRLTYKLLPHLGNAGRPISLSAWPPDPNSPVSFDSHGNVVSRFHDDIWDFSDVAGKNCKVYFTPVSTKHADVAQRNRQTFKEVTAWWLFGHRRATKPSSLRTYHSRFSVLVRFATREGIDLKRFSEIPGDIRRFAKQLSSSHADTLLIELQSLLTFSDEVGFVILDKKAMSVFSRSLPDHTRRQTAYVPPRIWKYQLDRLNEYLTDFLENKDKLSSVYRRICEVYLANQVCAKNSTHIDKQSFSPFLRQCVKYPGATYLGPISEFLADHGLIEFMEKWCKPRERLRLWSVGSMLSMASFAASALITNLTGMRIGEVFSLRRGCFIAESDDILGTIYFIRGKTTKTLEQDDALWITCHGALKAIDALEVVHALRYRSSPAEPDQQSALLFTWSVEPWASAKDMRPANQNILPTLHSYHCWEKQFPKLFDPEQLRIQPRDLDEARRVTPTLDSKRFALGSLWPLAWHQLRRTTAVNMSASGVVSDASLQYQLKHLSRSMSIYYGRGYSSKAISRDMQAEYLKAALESTARASEDLFLDRFISPFGQEHKLRILGSAAPAGAGRRTPTPVFRRTLLGVCVKATSCPSGGFDDIGPCMGGDGSKGCADAMIDRERREILERLLERKQAELSDCVVSEGRRNHVASQVRSLELSLELINGT